MATRILDCNKCGMWEEMSADEQRWHFNEFLYFPNNGEYKCRKCGSFDINEKCGKKFPRP